MDDDRSYFVYLLRCADDTLYCGFTTDVTRRVEQHNTSNRGARYTRGRRPVELVGYARCGSVSEALVLEARVKKLERREKLKRFVGRRGETLG